MDLAQTYEVQVLSDNLKHPNAPPKELREKMRAAKEGGCRIVMVITSLDDTGIHGSSLHFSLTPSHPIAACLKSYEQEMGIVTQAKHNDYPHPKDGSFLEHDVAEAPQDQPVRRTAEQAHVREHRAQDEHEAGRPQLHTASAQPPGGVHGPDRRPLRE